MADSKIFLFVLSPPRGQSFEHFIIVEMHRLNHYGKKDYSFFYLRTKDDAEIDLILERPGMPLALIEIKSKNKIDERDTASLSRFVKSFENSEAYLLSNDPISKKIGPIMCLPWQVGISEVGL